MREFSVAMLLALFCIGGGRPLPVEGGQKKPPESGSKARVAARNNALENANVQWSADPERGWVRAQEPREEKRSTASPESRKGKAEPRAPEIRDY